MPRSRSRIRRPRRINRRWIECAFTFQNAYHTARQFFVGGNSSQGAAWDPGVNSGWFEPVDVFTTAAQPAILRARRPLLVEAVHAHSGYTVTEDDKDFLPCWYAVGKAMVRAPQDSTTLRSTVQAGDLPVIGQNSAPEAFFSIASPMRAGGGDVNINWSSKSKRRLETGEMLFMSKSTAWSDTKPYLILTGCLRMLVREVD